MNAIYLYEINPVHLIRDVLIISFIAAVTRAKWKAWLGARYQRA